MPLSPRLSSKPAECQHVSVLPASTQFGAHSAGRERSSLTCGAVVTVPACGWRCSKATIVRSATHSLSHSTEIKAAGLIAAAGLDKVKSATLVATRPARRNVQVIGSRGSKAMSFRIYCRTVDVVTAGREKKLRAGKYVHCHYPAHLWAPAVTTATDPEDILIDMDVQQEQRQ